MNIFERKKKAMKAVQCFLNAFAGTIHLWTLLHLGQMWTIFAC